MKALRRVFVIVAVVAALLSSCDADEIIWVLEQEVACCEGDESACQALRDTGRVPSSDEGGCR